MADTGWQSYARELREENKKLQEENNKLKKDDTFETDFPYYYDWIVEKGKNDDLREEIKKLKEEIKKLKAQ